MVACRVGPSGSCTVVESAVGTGAGSASLIELGQGVPFSERHIGPSEADRAKMLAVLGYGSLDELSEAAVPATIRLTERLNLPPARSEDEVGQELRDLAGRNRVLRSMIGLGYRSEERRVGKECW